MNEDFINWFKTTSYYKELLNLQPELIALGGSRASHLEKADSDYDIIVYTQNTKGTGYSSNKHYGENFNGKHFHAMIYNLNDVIDQICDSLYNCQRLWLYIGMIANFYTFSTDNNIIYCTDRGRMFIEYMLDHNKEIALIGATNLSRELSLQIKILSQKNEFKLFDWKVYLYLLLSYDIIFEEDNTELLKKLRIYKIDTLEEKEKNKLLLMSKKLNNFIVENYDNEKDKILQFKLHLGGIFYGK